MKKHSLLLVAALLISLCLTACSAKSGGGISSDVPDMAPAASTAPMAPAEGEEVYGIAQDSKAYTTSTTTTVTKDAKLILRANLSIQSTEFDTAVATLSKLVADQQGYYERNEIQQGDYYDARAARYGSFTIRVPQARFESFLNAAGTVGHVVSSSKSSEDVSEDYYDTEARLKTQQTKHERLLALLEKADNMESIIALESALADVEYQIERLTGTLRKYDSLVGYSTVEIQLNEVLKITEQPKETASLSGRLSNAFSSGLENLGKSLSNLAVWAAYHFVGILVFAAIMATAVVVCKKQLRKRRGESKPTEPGE